MKNLSDYAEVLMAAALRKAGTFEDAEDLISETLIAALGAEKSGFVAENKKAWLLAVLNNKFADSLRKKYAQTTHPLQDTASVPDNSQSALEVLVKNEEEEKIRLGISRLTQTYREIIVRHYVHGQNIPLIAKEMKIPENTVKSRLAAARVKLKEDFENGGLYMKRFEKQSFEPDSLHIAVHGIVEPGTGPFKINNAENLMDQNLLVLAYKKPVTVESLSAAIGIAVPYIEPAINRLVDLQLMKRTGNRVYTDFVIFSEDDIKNAADYDKQLAEENYRDIWQDMSTFFADLHAKPFYKTLSAAQRERLELFSAIHILEQAVYGTINMRFGNENDEYMHTPRNGWEGHVFGFHHQGKTEPDWSAEGLSLYELNGCYTYTIPEKYQGKKLYFMAYSCACGRTFEFWWNLPAPLKDDEALKILYAIHSGTPGDIPLIKTSFENNIELMEQKGFFHKAGSSLVLDIPVIAAPGASQFTTWLSECTATITQNHRAVFEKLISHPVKLPSHLTSVPDFLRCYNCGSHFTMSVIFKAQWNGLYLAGRDFSKNPLPPLVILSY